MLTRIAKAPTDDPTLSVTVFFTDDPRALTIGKLDKKNSS